MPMGCRLGAGCDGPPECAANAIKVVSLIGIIPVLCRSPKLAVFVWQKRLGELRMRF